MKAEVAVVGNGVAGYACAARLAKHGIRPLLIGLGLPVDRPPLTKAALADGRPRLLADAAKLAERGIDCLDALVIDAELDRGRLRAGGGDDAVAIDATTIVLATGLHYTPPSIPGIEAAIVNADPGVFDRIPPRLEGGVRRVVVIGAGLIGTESAATLATQGHDVTVLDILERPLDRLHDPIPALAAAALERAGARFHGDVAISELREDGGCVTVCCNLGELPADVVLAATGGRPLLPPGIEPGVELPLTVDSAMRLGGFEHAHAVGDAIVVPHTRFGAIRFPHWDMAIGTGEHAADAIAGVRGELARLPYWWSDIGPTTLAEVGWAGAAVGWAEEDGLHVGRDADGCPVAALVVDEPRRLRDARALVDSAG